jgi:hypothetical protein
MPARERTFVDDAGVQWTVRAVDNPTMPPALTKLLGPDRRRNGWLIFTSAEGQRRRLSPYPLDWTSVSDFEIVRWCMKAAPVPPAPGRRRQDF